MRATIAQLVGVSLVVLLAGHGPAAADETDNFTCRSQPMADAQDAVDRWMNEALRDSVEVANRRGARTCDWTCLTRLLQKRIGASAPHPATWIPHARLALWMDTQARIDHCRLAFRESIYGAAPYDQPWLFPFTGRVIFLADSIRLSGRIVGIDKINHFIREGLAHWRAVDRGDAIASVLARELGAPRRQLLMNEHGLKGLSLTGVVSYADLAASYSGFRFWRDLLSSGLASSFVAEQGAGRFVVRRQFAIADYVNDAWDETINRSSFDARLGRAVAAALRKRAIALDADCRALARLPSAELYVNPACLKSSPVNPDATSGFRLSADWPLRWRVRKDPPYACCHRDVIPTP
jgi:hypothetical protein